jgi:hypothetical protein
MYYGATAQRDEAVVKRVAEMLALHAADEVEVVTGGMPGIPDDFAAAWWAAGGRHVLCVVSSEHEAAYRERNLPYACMVAGETQTARRLAVTKLEGIKAALFVQGGKYSTHEMRLLSERGVPIVAFHGSGGAAGGGESYQDWHYDAVPYREDSAIDSRDPATDPGECAVELWHHVLEALRK